MQEQEINYNQTLPLAEQPETVLTNNIGPDPDLQQAIQLYEMVYRAANPKASTRNIKRVIQRKFGVKVTFEDKPENNTKI